MPVVFFCLLLQCLSANSWEVIQNLPGNSDKFSENQILDLKNYEKLCSRSRCGFCLLMSLEAKHFFFKGSAFFSESRISLLFTCRQKSNNVWHKWEEKPPFHFFLCSTVLHFALHNRKSFGSNIMEKTPIPHVNFTQMYK